MILHAILSTSPSTYHLHQNQREPVWFYPYIRPKCFCQIVFDPRRPCSGHRLLWHPCLYLGGFNQSILCVRINKELHVLCIIQFEPPTANWVPGKFICVFFSCLVHGTAQMPQGLSWCFAKLCLQQVSFNNNFPIVIIAANSYINPCWL